MALPVVLSLLDVAVTLRYQPAGYWAGDRAQVVEGNPLVWVALRVHPALLVPGCLGWYALFYFLIFRTPAWVGLRCHVLWVGGHLIAIAGWLIHFHPHGYEYTALLYAIAVPTAIGLFRPFREQWNSEVPVVVPAVAAASGGVAG
jgi:hypothetical protein